MENLKYRELMYRHPTDPLCIEPSVHHESIQGEEFVGTIECPSRQIYDLWRLGNDRYITRHFFNSREVLDDDRLAHIFRSQRDQFRSLESDWDMINFRDGILVSLAYSYADGKKDPYFVLSPERGYYAGPVLFTGLTESMEEELDCIRELLFLDEIWEEKND